MNIQVALRSGHAVWDSLAHTCYVMELVEIICDQRGLKIELKTLPVAKGDRVSAIKVGE